MVGILVSFWNGEFPGAMLVSGRVYIYTQLLSILAFPRIVKKVATRKVVETQIGCWRKCLSNQVVLVMLTWLFI